MKKFLGSLSMKWRLAVGATALALGLIAVVSTIQVHFLRQDMAETVSAQQSALVTQVGHDLDAKLAANVQALQKLAKALPPAVLRDPAQFRTHFAQRPALAVLFDDFLLVGVDGRIAADFPVIAGRAGIDVSQRDYFKRAMATGAVTISEPIHRKVNGEPIVSVAAPVRSPEGEVKAVLVGTIRLLRDNYLGSLSSAKVGATGYFFILTRGEKPVYVMHPDKSRILSERPPGANPSTTRAIAGFEGTVEDTNSSGTHALFSYRRLATTDWLLASVLPVDEAFAPIVRAERRTVVVAAIVALLFTPLVWLLAWKFFAPLTLLLRSINDLRSVADRDAEPPGVAVDEFASLQRSFRALMAEREGAELRLRDSEQRIRNITDNLPALICYIDHERRFRFNNLSYEKWLHRPLSEITGKTVLEVYGEAINERLGHALDRALRGEPTRFEVDFPGRDGRVHHARGSYRPDFDDQGRVRGVYGLISDVTRLKDAEDLLLEERGRMARIIEGTNAGTWEWNIVTREIRVNARWAQMLGYALEELGTVTVDTWLAFMQPDDAGRARELLAPHFDGSVDHSAFEIRMRHRSGEWLSILVYGRVSARDGEGHPLWMHGVSLDNSARKQAEDALRLSRQVLERTGQVAGVGGWEVDLRTRKVTWTDETCRLHDVEVGHEPDLDAALAYYTDASRPIMEAAVEEAIRSGTPWDLELELVSARGRPFWARAVGTVEYEDGEPVRLVGAFQDVSVRKAIEDELAEGRELMQTTLDSIGDAVITTDVSGNIRWLNPVAERMTGWTKAEAAGLPVAQVFVIIDEETRMAVIDPVAACIKQGKIVGMADKTMLLSRNGDEYGIEDSASPIRGEDGECHGVVLVFHDVSEARRLSREMTHRAMHDPLTGLANRLEFEVRLQRLFTAVEGDDSRHAVLYIDLDQFKLVNDACGHSVGDQLLQQVSALLRRCVRGRDTVARLGGDEFGVILEHCSLDQAGRVGQKICDEMEDFRFMHGDRRFRVGASIGLVPFDARWDSVASALQAADASCYAAKEGGRNRVHVWVETDGAMKTRRGEMQWVTRLEQALDEDRFMLYGQRIEPVASAAAPQAPLHCEVLLRLKEADGTVVLPGAFLPAAERFHMATCIDRWVVREVFAWLENAKDAEDGIALIAVNLSGQSIGDRSFHREVAKLIRGASFDVRKLCFEITETAAVTNFADAKSFIDEVRSFGVRIALDDFGAGTSSFGYLKNLPVDFLKIDGQFVAGLLDDALDDAAVRCFREVARAVGVQTIAEFVERQETRDALQAIGIDMAQGYLIHRPEPLERLMLATV